MEKNPVNFVNLEENLKNIATTHLNYRHLILENYSLKYINFQGIEKIKFLKNLTL